MARIQIALGTDMRYLEPTLVAMLSVLRSTPEPITVHLFGHNLSDQARQRCEAAARSRGAQPVFHRITHAMSARWRSNVYDYISPAAVASLHVPSTVGTGRCLFLDSDTICFGDIRPLYDVDLQGHQIAAVMDYCWFKDHIDRPDTLSVTKRLMAPHPHWQMFNGGVVLFDCDAINADAELSADLTANPVHTGDQLYLNQIFKGRAVFAHPCWNCLAGLPGHDAYVQREMVPPEFHFERLPARIWHFRGAIKPWNNDGVPQAPLPAHDDPLLDRVEPTDVEGFKRADAIRHAQYRRAAARLLAEAPPETA